ncbi:MAG: purine-nucleoside phosphorylase [Vampirovibrionales bacterium]
MPSHATHSTAEALEQQLNECVTYLTPFLPQPPKALIVLGSGLGKLVHHPDLQIHHTLPYSQIPHFPTSTVAGHAGQLVVATHTPTQQCLLLQQGRFHYYEGYRLDQVVLPVRVAKRLGATQVTLTNAAGSLRPDMPIGSIMLITDQLNLTGQNPLIGPNLESLGPRFFDMTETFTPQLQAKARAIAQTHEFVLFEGTYAGLTGPSYETPAEIKMLSLLGASTVGMSTVLEVLAARHAGLKIQAFSVVSNLAAGLQGEALNHEEVMALANSPLVGERLSQLVLESL